jgi:DNA-directed RNA polymerase subunit RPC12/RpoP
VAEPSRKKKYEPQTGTPRCPACNSDVLYRYGRTASGKKRYLCLICNRQFVENPLRDQVRNRPVCPKCGSPMHIYMREQAHIRFRCANYPECRTFYKLPREAVEDYELHHS